MKNQEMGNGVWERLAVGRSFVVPVVLACAVLLCGLAVTGCDKASGPGSGQGDVRMSMVDAPAQFDAVTIVVSRVEVHIAGNDSVGGWTTVSTDSASYDLLQLRNGASALLGSARIQAGHYTQIRLVLGAGSEVVIGGLHYPLEVASGFQTGVKLIHEFTISEDAVTELTLDFDAERSVRAQGLGYRLTPVIRVVATVTSGEIAGTVLPVAAHARATAIAGADTVTASDCDENTGAFRLVALPEGSYDVHVHAEAGAYRDTVLANVMVTRQQSTNVGTVSLSAQ